MRPRSFCLNKTQHNRSHTHGKCHGGSLPAAACKTSIRITKAVSQRGCLPTASIPKRGPTSTESGSEPWLNRTQSFTEADTGSRDVWGWQLAAKSDNHHDPTLRPEAVREGHNSPLNVWPFIVTCCSWLSPSISSLGSSANAAGHTGVVVVTVLIWDWVLEYMGAQCTRSSHTHAW
jgi:hypothetical protein